MKTMFLVILAALFAACGDMQDPGIGGQSAAPGQQNPPSSGTPLGGLCTLDEDCAGFPSNQCVAGKCTPGCTGNPGACPTGTACVLERNNFGRCRVLEGQTPGTTPCAAPNALCGSVCVNPQADLNNCGACGRVCVAGQTCSAGTCVSTTPSCTAPARLCGSACVNTLTDTANCGSCGVVCNAAGATCVGGTCVLPTATCSAPNSLCGNACVNIASDAGNCGACGKACASNQVCNAGACVTPTTGTGSALCVTGTTPAPNPNTIVCWVGGSTVPATQVGAAVCCPDAGTALVVPSGTTGGTCVGEHFSSASTAVHALILPGGQVASWVGCQR